MPTVTTIPVTITPEADAFIDEVGQRREFEAMRDYLIEAVPDLRLIEVRLDDTPETGPPSAVLWAYRDDSSANESLDWDWGDWKIATFPPEVCVNFTMISFWLPPDGR